MKNTISFALTAAIVLAVSSSVLIAADPVQPISVRVKSTDSGAASDRFLMVDPQKDDVVKEVEKALSKYPGLQVTKFGDATSGAIVLGVTNVCTSMGSEIRPKQSELANQMIWVIDTDDAIVTNGGSMRRLRSFSGTGVLRSVAVEAVAKDFAAWVAANHASLAAGRK